MIIFLKYLIFSLAIILTLIFGLWGYTAIHLLAPWPGMINSVIGIVFFFSLITAVCLSGKFKLRFIRVLLVLIPVVLWYQLIFPQQDRNWLPDVRVLPSAAILGDRLEITNVRAFNYRSENDYDVRYEKKHFNLRNLSHLDLFMSYWGSPAIAHPILSFGFKDGQQLAISIETRKEVGESYSAINGFFKAYELIYIPALESDVIKLRTNFRNEDVYLYRLRTPLPRIRKLLEKYVARIRRLHQRAEFYNAAFNNCTTNIFFSFKSFLPILKMDYRVLLSGYLDEFAYHNGALYQELPFEELKKKSYISLKARAVKEPADFSIAIREGLLISTTLNE